MRTTLRACLTVVLLLVVVGSSRAQEDRAGCSDHPLLSRMQDFYISSCREYEYDSHTFVDTKRKKYVIEGHKWLVSYKLKQGVTPPGVLNIRRNYINAIKKIGGTILSESYRTHMKVASGGRETWIEVNLATTTTGDNYSLTIVERSTMEQEVTADPEAMASDINSTGHVAVYGIYFDHDSYTMKSESAPTLVAIAEMLKNEGALQVYIVGHTDMTGRFDYNMELSHNRAQAVVDALVNHHGISADRLTAKGAGPLAPIGTNDTEEGRKLNRRVELVKRQPQETE